jgi:DtxR family Mn-dependent transcriptional regulator
MISQTEENYLKALYSVISVKGEAGVNEIGKLLSIKMPTVNSMMKRLAEKGLVIHESYKPLKLTPEGMRQAALIIRKHRLTEMYLVEKMGFGWEEVHHIAEQIEHIKAPEFFDKMDALLGYPKVDPHGSPIPDPDGNITPDHYSRLSDCQQGDVVTLMAVQESSEEFLKFLNSRKLALGVQMTVNNKEEFDQSMSVSYDDHREMLSSKVCDKLLVSKS